MTEIPTETSIANPAPAAPNPAAKGTSNDQNRQRPPIDLERIAELERKLDEAKRQLTESTAKIERALGR